MSKVKIQGNASGTGVLTVTAPNTSTDRTITLPDGTGTLIADDGSGNLGIGTASPSAATGFNAPAFEVSGSDPSIILSKTGADSIALVNHASHLKILNDTDDRAIAHIHQDAPANTLIVQSDGSLLVGTTDGGSSGAGDIVASAIFLGGNQAANELDDYEEGTATLTPVCQAGSVTLKSTHNTLKYTKIGNKVFWQYHMRIDTISSPAGWFQLRGLPFTNASGEVNRVNITGHPAYNFSSPSGSMLTGYIVENDTKLIPYFYNGSTGILNAAGYLQANTEAYFSGNYSTT